VAGLPVRCEIAVVKILTNTLVEMVVATKQRVGCTRGIPKPDTYLELYSKSAIG
jgi:hypothetical protein